MFGYQSPSNWTGRVDTEDGQAGLRWHQVVNLLDFNAPLPKAEGYCLLGFACDEGVRRNQGRTGAAQGPARLREWAGSLPKTNVPLFDAGDVFLQIESETPQAEFDQAHELLALKTRDLLQVGYFPILLGGGHDIAFGHYVGYSQAGFFPAIINLDAHFDLRKPAPLPTSGTPFYQIAQLCRSHSRPFRYFCAGIQKQANTQALFDTAERLSVGYSYTLDKQLLSQYLPKGSQVLLSLDLDVMNLPGVSASNPLGFSLKEVIAFMDWIRSTYEVVGFEIAELNPRFDADNLTAKSAAWLLWEFVSKPYSLETLNMKLS